MSTESSMNLGGHVRSVLSTLKTVATRIFGSGAPQFAPPCEETTKAEERPRLMVEAPGRNPFGRALLYVPIEGLFTVHPDGTTTPLRHISLLRREGKDVIFPMSFPLGEGHTIRFAGPGCASDYYYQDDEGVGLVELAQGEFKLTWSADPDSVGGNGRKYYVTLR